MTKTGSRLILNWEYPCAGFRDIAHQAQSFIGDEGGRSSIFSLIYAVITVNGTSQAVTLVEASGFHSLDTYIKQQPPISACRGKRVHVHTGPATFNTLRCSVFAHMAHSHQPRIHL